MRCIHISTSLWKYPAFRRAVQHMPGGIPKPLYGAQLHPLKAWLVIKAQEVLFVSWDS